MTVQPWSDYARDEWARIADPLTVDEEPWDPPTQDPADLLDVAPAAIAWWAVAMGAVAAALVVVLALLGLGRRKRQAIGPGISWPDYDYLDERAS